MESSSLYQSALGTSDYTYQDQNETRIRGRSGTSTGRSVQFRQVGGGTTAMGGYGGATGGYSANLLSTATYGGQQSTGGAPAAGAGVRSRFVPSSSSLQRSQALLPSTAGAGAKAVPTSTAPFRPARSTIGTALDTTSRRQPARLNNTTFYSTADETTNAEPDRTIMPPKESILGDINTTLLDNIPLRTEDGNLVIRSPIKHTGGRVIDIQADETQRQLIELQEKQHVIAPVPTTALADTTTISPITGFAGTPSTTPALPTRGGIDTLQQPYTAAGGRPRQRLVVASPANVLSPAQVDPFYEVGAGEAQSILLGDLSCWVTIFGFPPSKADYILRQFSQYGDILDHRIPDQACNYMHVLYRTKFQAQKALSKNGKIFEGVLMIGVVECIDRSVLTSAGRRRAARPQASTIAVNRLPATKKRPITDISAAAGPTTDEPFGQQQQQPQQKRPRPQRSIFAKVTGFLFRT